MWAAIGPAILSITDSTAEAASSNHLAARPFRNLHYSITLWTAGERLHFRLFSIARNSLCTMLLR